MKLCMMSLMMGRTPVREIVSCAVSCGMEAIDWIGLHGTSAAELKRLCEDAGLPVAAHTLYTGDDCRGEPENFDLVRQAVENAGVLGAKVLMLPPFPSRNQISLADDRGRYVDFYGCALELAASAGITVTLESTGFVNSPVVTADECLELLRQLPGLRVTFDIGNAATAEDPLAAWEKLRSYTVHLHIKDWRISDTSIPGGTIRRNGRYFADAMLGEGDMPLAEFWKTLAPAERNLWVNPESTDFSGSLPPCESMREICRRMRCWEV